jgi:hypothetical protein
VNTSTDSQPRLSDDTDDYRLLHKYLLNRFADRVVLTFAQIEDLLGFSLPLSASLERGWWGGDASDAWTRQSAVWTFAGRRVMANLAARSVTFERDISASAEAS